MAQATETTTDVEVVHGTVVLDRPPGLADVAEQANRAHFNCREHAQNAVHYAIEAGEYLNRAKMLVVWGQWGEWLAKNFDGSQALATTYMRLHAHRDKIIDAPSVKAALEAISHERLQKSPELIAYVRAQLKEGESQTDIAARIGIHPTTLHYWLNPRKSRKRRAGANTARDRQRLETEKLGKKVKGPVADSYANVRRALQRLEWARDIAPGGEASRAINAAMRSLYNAEDSIGDALRKWGVEEHQKDVVRLQSAA